MKRILKNIIKLWLCNLHFACAVQVSITKFSGELCDQIEISDENYSQLIGITGKLNDEFIRQALGKDPVQCDYVHDPAKNPGTLTEIECLVGEKRPNEYDTLYAKTLITNLNGLRFKLYSSTVSGPDVPSEDMPLDLKRRFRIKAGCCVKPAESKIGFSFKYNGVKIKIGYYLSNVCEYDNSKGYELITEMNGFITTCQNALEKEPECKIIDRRQDNSEPISDLHAQLFRCVLVMNECFNSPSHQSFREIFKSERLPPSLDLSIKTGEILEDQYPSPKGPLKPLELLILASLHNDGFYGIMHCHRGYLVRYQLFVDLHDIILLDYVPESLSNYI